MPTALLDRGLSGDVRKPQHRTIELAACARPTNVARSEVRNSLAGHMTGERIDDIVLVVDELIVNATQHGGGCLRLKLDLYHGCLLLWVYDRNSDQNAVRPRCAHDTDQDGRGLQIVGELAQRWFPWPSPDGKAVVAVFTLPSHENGSR